MIVYKDTEYDSKAAVVRAMFLTGDMDNSPDQKKRVAALLGMTVQTVHATLVKMNDKPSVPNVPKIIATLTPAPVMPKKVVEGYADVRRFIEQRYDECYKIAESKGIKLAKINIDWSLKGTVAGQFCWRGGLSFFKVNLELAQANLNDYLKQTIPHEFSHYIVRAKYKNLGYSVKPHGWEWKQTMLSVFGLYPHRCHQYDVLQVKQSRRHFEYKCNCQTWQLGAKRYRNLQLNPRRYWCPTCKGHLTFVKHV